MVSLNTNILRAAQRGLDRAILLHLFDPNVSLIDLGWRIRDSEGQRIEDELCVRVHVRRKLYAKAFRAFAAQQPERIIDPQRIGFPVDVPQADYGLSQGWPSSSTMLSNPRSGVFNPMQGGISISNTLKYGYGTLGGKVVDRQTGAKMILSNWHVLVASWYAWPGIAIYQPGRGDGGGPQHTIAHLKRHAMNQYIDAAVAELTDTRPLIDTQFGIGPVTGAIAPQLDMRVTKSGRTSGVTSGIITGIEGRQAIYYEGVRQTIAHIVHIAQTPKGGEVSAPGDSGSWWLTSDTRQAAGLHFAGSNSPEYGLAIAMPQVLDALDVDIVPDTRSLRAATAQLMTL